MVEPSQESLEKAKNMARNGIVRDNMFNLDMTVYEYAQHLDNIKVSSINVRINDIEKELAAYERKQDAAAADEILKDPKIRKFFKLDEEA